MIFFRGEKPRNFAAICREISRCSVFFAVFLCEIQNLSLAFNAEKSFFFFTSTVPVLPRVHDKVNVHVLYSKRNHIQGIGPFYAEVLGKIWTFLKWNKHWFIRIHNTCTCARLYTFSIQTSIATLIRVCHS